MTSIDETVRRDEQLPPPAVPPAAPRPRRRVAPFVGGGLLCLLSVICLVGGGWALWKDRVSRDGAGFVSFGSTELRTEQYAIVGDLRGDGPSWLYGSSVFGKERVRATSDGEAPLFIGIARKDDVMRYLHGVGYATVYSFEVSDDTTHPGAAPSAPPSAQSIWAVSTQGSGEQTLLWSPRAGDWSVVLMNADASATVDVRGDASAKLPVLPWLAAALLVVGVASGFASSRVLLSAIRRHQRSAQPELAVAADYSIEVERDAPSVANAWPSPDGD